MSRRIKQLSSSVFIREWKPRRKHDLPFDCNNERNPVKTDAYTFKHGGSIVLELETNSKKQYIDVFSERTGNSLISRDVEEFYWVSDR